VFIEVPNINKTCLGIWCQSEVTQHVTVCCLCLRPVANGTRVLF